MAQWINVLQNNSFVNLKQLPLLCRNSRAAALAQLSLMAGWLAGRQNAGKFQIFKIHLDQIFLTFATLNKVTASLDRAI